MRVLLGFDARELTPVVVQRMTRTAAETRSFARAAIVMDEAVGLPISAKTIERVVHDVGGEWAQRRDADPKSDDALAVLSADPPQLAVVACDGGRIRTREPGHGPGVHRTGQGWREDKNACLIRALRTVWEDDPLPEPPPCFGDPKHVAKMPRPRRCRSRPSCPTTPPATATTRGRRDRRRPRRGSPNVWFAPS